MSATNHVRRSARPKAPRPGGSVRRRTAAALAALATAVGLAVPLALATPASAAPGDPVWAASGTGTTQTVSDGTVSAAQMTYNADGSGSGTWEFTATAAADGTVKVPYTWQGLHAWFLVTAQLDTFVGSTVTKVFTDGPTSCCDSPSNGFLYGGVATFDVRAGQVYGFRMSGSNSDSNNFLRGTLTLSTKPYLDATIGTDNRQWTGAETLPAGDPGIDRSMAEPGEARWYRFPVVPGQQATVELTGLANDDDIALYGDISNAFDQLSSGTELTQLAASAQGAPGSGTQIPGYPTAATHIPKSNVTPQFAPHIYAPHIYAPHIYAPHIYAPHIYAPHIYAPDAYDPSLSGSPAFSEAFSAAQDQTLLAVSTNTGSEDETVSAPTGNTSGYFYVRVQGHTEQTPAGSFHLHLDVTDDAGTNCVNLTDDSDLPLGLTPSADQADPASVIVSDTNRLGLTAGSSDHTRYLASLDSLANATDGVRLDVAASPRVQALWTQVAAHPTCPYAVNLVAEAIKDVIDQYRGPDTKYVVLGGGDDVIPFFRYPDISGLGQESQFSPPVRDNTPSGASLKSDQVQSQDAYGSDTDVTISGVTIPVPDLAVGRLVKFPDEIESTISHYLALSGGTLRTPRSSLVTGYDFLADAADAVHDQFAQAIPAGTNETLIDHPGVDDGTADQWTGGDLGDALLGSHHDLVYLAGHFSANDALAADFTTTLDAGALAPEGAHPTALEDTVVLSAGCHSGYNIVNGAYSGANPFDWTQRMAEQHAILIGGTGYQYGDSDFLEYSERLYLDVAKRLREGPDSGAAPVAVGSALVKAKQDYLSGLSTVSGIDEKAMLESTLYGLPMTGFDAPGRTTFDSAVSDRDPQPVGGDTPGHTFGLLTDDLSVDTPTESHTKDSGVDHSDPAQASLPDTSTWLSGRDGVTVLPGAPATPKQIENVTVPGQVLRGVGFRSADYTDTTGILPVTGAPAIEGSTPNTTFESSSFFPQRLITPNYFGTLGSSGRTSLILTPGQYRSDAPDVLTDTQRAYSHMDMRLFYSGSDSRSFGQNQPSLAAAPGIGNVRGTVTGGKVTFSATVTGDPSAGVQQVWVTWTGTGDDSGHGHWRSVDLTQDQNDSTHWTGTLDLPDHQSSDGMRFLVQAANGVGAVGLDTADGDGYQVFPAGADTSVVTLHAHAATSDSPLGVTAGVVDDQGAPVAGRAVHFTVTRGTVELYSGTALTGPSGSAELGAFAPGSLPSGRLVVRAEILTASGGVQSFDTLDIVRDGVTFTLDPGSLTTLAGTAYPAATPLTATLEDDRGPVVGVPVTFTLPTGSPGATFPDGGTSATVTTGDQGVAAAPQLTARTAVGTFLVTVSADGATPKAEAMAAQYGFGTFSAPISNTGITQRNAASNTPLAVSALLAGGVTLDDATARGLISQHRVQIRWREAGSRGDWTADTSLAAYDAKQHAFTADLKASRLGMVKGTTYTVTLRILPGDGDVRPAGESVLNGSFDLGSRSFTLTLT